MDIIIPIAFLAFIVALIVWVVKYTKKVNARKRQFFQDLGNKHNLQHLETKRSLTRLNSLSGKIKDMDVQIYEHIVGSGKSQQILTTVQLTPSPFDFEFRIGKEHFFSKTGKLLGMKDIEMGDEEFDKIFLLKSKEEDKFRAVLTYDVQQRLKSISSDLTGSIYGNLGNLSYSAGVVAKEAQFKQLEKVFDFMLSLDNERPGRKVSY
ncbi:MAG: hypothetical protein ABJG68_15430 [Crocinitomicaceae bacterium]